MPLTSITSNKDFPISEITLRFLQKDDIHQVKELCTDWFPIQYPSIWYETITATDFYYTLAAFHEDLLVGLIVTQTKPLYSITQSDQKVLSISDLKGGNIGYILALGVRKEYRRQGIASLLLDQYIEHLRLDYMYKNNEKLLTTKCRVIHNGNSGICIKKYSDANRSSSFAQSGNEALKNYSNLFDQNIGCTNHDCQNRSCVIDIDSDINENQHPGGSLSDPNMNCYVVETTVNHRSVVERLQCAELTSAHPVLAVMLHVLTNNNSAINFYSKKKFIRLGYLPKFYTIDDHSADGYSYILFINGSSYSGAPDPSLHSTSSLKLLSYVLDSMSTVFGNILSMVRQGS